MLVGFFPTQRRQCLSNVTSPTLRREGERRRKKTSKSRRCQLPSSVRFEVVPFAHQTHESKSPEIIAWPNKDAEGEEHGKNNPKRTKKCLTLMDAVAIFVPSRFIEIHRKSESWAYVGRTKGCQNNEEETKGGQTTDLDN